MKVVAVAGVDYAGYETQARNINTDYAAKTAAAAYGRFVAQQRGSRQLGDAARGFSTGYPKLASSWGTRGARPGIQSGFYQQAMQNYLGDYQRNTNDINVGIANDTNAANLAQTSLDTERQRALADLELQKQQAIANLAQNIAAVRTNV